MLLCHPVVIFMSGAFPFNVIPLYNFSCLVSFSYYTKFYRSKWYYLLSQSHSEINCVTCNIYTSLVFFCMFSYKIKCLKLFILKIWEIFTRLISEFLSSILKCTTILLIIYIAFHLFIYCIFVYTVFEIRRYPFGLEPDAGKVNSPDAVTSHETIFNIVLNILRGVPTLLHFLE